MKLNIFLLFALSSVNAHSVLYTIESFTTDKQPCMSNCIDGKCKADSSSHLKACTVGWKPGYQYYTALKESDQPLCRSRCGRFGEDYDWCYVSDTLDWDYCSSNTNRELVTHEYTKSYGPCNGACARRGEDYLWCYTFWPKPNYWDYCDDTYNSTYIQSYTRKGAKCIGHCKKQEGTSYNWCRYLDGWDYCAVSAKSVYKKGCHESCNKRARRADDDVDEIDALNQHCLARPGLIRDFAAAMENRPELTSSSVADRNNPVTSYTVFNPRTPNEPVLPVVIRARIEPRHLPVPGSRPSGDIPSEVYTNLRRMGLVRNDPENNNDEAGHLIGFQNGGPYDVYNFAPQTRRLNRGTNDGFVIAPSIWLQDEGYINNWVRAGGVVDEVVVVLYDDPETEFRPAGFGTSIRYLLADGTLHHACPEYFFSNNPRFY